MERMHALYRAEGLKREMPPQAVYAEPDCPYSGCAQRLQGVDFRVEDYGSAVRDALVQSWWSDIGFAGRCPKCGGWIHFTVRRKEAITAAEAAQLPQLPDDWHANAMIL
jgi:hypothetical protein